jgi:alkylated DNA repair dioxygenase AlkB
MYECMARIDLSAEHSFWQGELPAELRLGKEEFEVLWGLHPESFHEILIHGRRVRTPRWQQAYGKDYEYTGRVNRALPMGDLTVKVPRLERLLPWCERSIHPRLNGVLVNWYDGALGHYIGKHRDSTQNMVRGAPIVTISFGERRLFRLRPWKGPGFRDFEALDGGVLVMPFETNRAWMHEVPKGEKYRGRRISITVRAFR